MPHPFDAFCVGVIILPSLLSITTTTFGFVPKYQPSTFHVSSSSKTKSPTANTKYDDNIKHQDSPSQLFSLKNDLASIKDLDPENDDDDGTQTKMFLNVALAGLEKLIESDDLNLVQEFFDDDDDDDDDDKSKKVTKSVSEGPKPKAVEKSEAMGTVEKKKDKSVAPEKSTLRQAVKLIKILLKADVFSKRNLNYATYPRHPEYPGIDLSGAMRMLDGIPPLEYFFSVKKFLRLLRRVLKMAVGLRLTADDVEDATTIEEKYNAIFTKDSIMFGLVPNPLNLVPKPKYVSKHWEDDKEFARQFLCGVNPVMINVVTDLEEQISTPLIEKFGKIRLQTLVRDKRLLFVSYDDIVLLQEESYKNPHMSHPLNEEPPEPPRYNQPRFFHAPIVLFELDKNRKDMDVMGIQLERRDDAKIYTRKESGKDEWLFVKSCVASADSQMHEWVSHLAKTHLTMEPHIIAIHNTLKKNKHPIYTYVKPLCKDTLLLNWAARLTLAKFGPNSFGDYISSVGVGQFMQLIGVYWSRYDFFSSSSFPSELESRGFDESFKMPGYLFREDGLKLWDAYGQFARDFVDECYKDDAEVRADKVLQEWAKETVRSDRAAVPGFPSVFKDKETLAKVLQTFNWICGGLHAAVNFPQYEFYSYPPNKPLGLKGDGIPDDEHIQGIKRNEIFSNHMPDMVYMQKGLTTVDLLTFQTGHTIDNLDGEFEDVGKNSYEKLLVKLSEIGDEIEERNKENDKKKKAVYHYLHPSVVPASIDI